MEKVKGNIYVETEFLGCNPSFVVTSSDIVMIDTPGLNPLEAFEWKKEIEKYGTVAYIINTDHHWDHTFGNYFFNGDIILHEGSMEKLFDEERLKDSSKNFEGLIYPQYRLFVEHYCIKKPRFTYNSKMDIYLGDEMFELIHIRGHTHDETIVYLPRKKVLFAGDNVCTMGIPNLSESFPKEWLESLEFMETLDIEVVVPGHGKIGYKDSIKKFHTELSSLLNRVKEKIDKGFTRDEIVNEVSYEDTIHLKYPPENLQRFRQNVKKGISRLYDVLIQNPLY